MQATPKSANATRKHYILIDGYGYVFRAYHALPPLTRGDGTPVGAVLGFTSMLLKLKSTSKSDGIAVIFDAGEKTFRNTIYPDYKANRPPAPEDLKPQFPLVREAAEALGLPVVSIPGYEADDIIATYARQAQEQGMEVTIVSSDKDLMQLVGNGIAMYDAMKDKTIGPEQVMEKFGVKPEQVRDVLALIGDASDNVPGVPGIGPKTAAELIAFYHTIENLLAHAADIPQPKRRENLIQNADKARLAYRLITLCDSVPVTQRLEDFSLREPEMEKLMDFLKKNAFRSIVSRVEKLYGKTTANNPEPLSVFVPPKKTHYTRIGTINALQEWSRQAASVGKCAVITHASGVALCHTVGIACFVPLPAETQDSQTTLHLVERHTSGLSPQEFFTTLKEIFENPTTLIIGHDIKTLCRRARDYGIIIQALDDVEVMSYVLDGTQHRHDLCTLAGKELQESLSDEKTLAAATDAENMTPLLCAHADAALALHAMLKARLFQEKTLTLYTTIERPLISVLADMEHAGIKVELKTLETLSYEFGREMEITEKEIYALAGHSFNIGSPKQLGEVLFTEMHIQGGQKSKKSGAYSTGVEVLEELAAQGHTIADKVLRWRMHSKLKNTYTDALSRQINPKTGRIHTTFTQTIANTGRLSSINPNLQNIPIRDEEGRKIRQAFVADKGCQLVSADYSQIELRLLAHVADIAPLKEAFREGRDIHALTASQVFGISLDKIDALTRRRAKAINFGIIYGQTAFGLARQLGIPRGEAQTYIETYFKQYPGIRAYMDTIKEAARKQGYVTTLFGRKCYLEGINDKNPSRRAFAERAAINAPLQGTAADIVKKAMIRLPDALKKALLSARLILQVHDELILEAPEKESEKTAHTVQKVMENVVILSVPIIAEARIGHNWGQIH